MYDLSNMFRKNIDMELFSMVYYKRYAYNMCIVKRENNSMLLREVEYG